MSKEDPATGSAAGPLAAYLFRHGLVGEGVGRVLVHQGLMVGRQCVIEVVLSRRQGESGEDEVDVDIMGKGVTIADGNIMVPSTATEF